VFRSEADFEHAMTWETHQAWPEQLVPLETRPAKGIHLDVLLIDRFAGREVALELKYLTASWQGVARQESFDLLSQGAQDIRAFNESNYWTPPSHSRITNAHQFRIHEDATMSGLRSWGPHTGVGTLENRENPIMLMGAYTCHWRDYSTLPGPRGRIRYLLIAVYRAS
jgi:hypothetical protein